MRVDLSPDAVGRRLRQVSALRKLCLSLARTSAGWELARKFPANETVRRTFRAIDR